LWGNAPTSVAERLVAFLRERHPVKTIDCIAAETGIARTTVAKWFERGGGPSAGAFLALVGAYGPDIICAVMHSPPDWLVAAKREARREALAREIAALEQELTRQAFPEDAA